MAFRNSILAGEELVRSGIRSENYVAGVSGWRVDRLGNAEFNDVTVRGSLGTGTITGTLTMDGTGSIRSAPGYPRVTIAGGAAAVRLEQADSDPITGSITAPGVLSGDLPAGVPRVSLSSGVRENVDLPATITLKSSDFTGSGDPAQIELGAGALIIDGEDVQGAWNPYSPVNTNITVGNGTQVASYLRLGKTCFVSWALTWGTTTAFTGGAAFGLPFQAVLGRAQSLSAWYLEAGVRNWIGAGRINSNGSTASLLHTEAGGLGFVNAANPFTFANGDSLTVTGVYEIG